MTEQEKHGTEGLVSGRGRGPLLDGQVRQEAHDVPGPHLDPRALAGELAEPAEPGEVGPLRPEARVPETKGLAHLGFQSGPVGHTP